MARTTGITDTAVRQATRRSWAEWVDLLSAAGARDWSHKEIVGWLAAHTDLSGWWRQSVAVGFEKAIGRRVVGQTADAGFQVGVRVTVAVALEEAWQAIVSPAGQEAWLGTKVQLEPKAPYEAPDGLRGEIRVVRPCDRIRFTRSPSGASTASTVQIALSRSGESKTAVTFHHEKLRGPEEREAMRTHWKAVAEQIKAMAGKR